MADVGPEESQMSRVARLMRHEVGDLLQGVYSVAAILLARLDPNLGLERQVIADLRLRAEQVRVEVDAAVRLTEPAPGTATRADLAGLTQAAVGRLRRHLPNVPVSCDAGNPVPIWADVGGFADAILLLLLGLGRGATAIEVRVARTGPPCCTLRRHGAPASSDQLEWLARPFHSTRESILGLALAACQQVVTAAGGAVRAENDPSGVTVWIELPPAAE